MRNREERVRAREARKEREAEEEQERETDDEQGGGAAQEQQQERTTVAKRTGTTLKAPTIAGNRHQERRIQLQGNSPNTIRNQ